MILYGKQVCYHALEHHTQSIKSVYLTGKHTLPKNLFHHYHNKIKFLEEKWAQSMSKGGNHQGILVEVEPFQETAFSQIKEMSFIVILDGLTDVGNIGAIVRSAYALGADAIIASGVRQLNFAAIARTSSGALLDMPFMIASNILDVFHELKQIGFKSYGATMNGQDVNQMQFAPKRILVLGSEGKGLSKKVETKIEYKVSIKMKHTFDSLNVSVAAGILIHRMDYAIT